ASIAGAVDTLIANRADAIASGQNMADVAGVNWISTQNTNAASLQGELASDAATRVTGQSVAGMANAQTTVLAQSSAMNGYAAAVNADTTSIVTSLQTWKTTLTEAANTNADAFIAAVTTATAADVAALATALEAGAASDKTLRDTLWTAWNQMNQGILTADETQVTNVGQEAVTLAKALVAAQAAFTDALSRAIGASGVTVASAQSTFQIAEAVINNAQALANASAELVVLRDREVWKFTSPYATSNGPGSNPGKGSSIWDWATTAAAGLDLLTGGTSDKILLSAEFGAALNANDAFFAGMADVLTAGISTKARAAIWGQSATQNHQGAYFEAGQYTGIAISLVGGVLSPCGLSTGYKVAYKGWQGVQVVGHGVNTIESIIKGNYLEGGLNALGMFGSLASFLKACFVAGTPIRTPGGSMAIEQLQVGDLVLSRDEFDPAGPLEYKVVEELFVRFAPVLNLHAGGRIIGTTAEHPFWVEGKGWTNAIDLRIDDVLVSHDGQQITVEGVADSGRIQTVYNFRVADFHTYFVGCDEWGFSIWAHNAEYAPTIEQIHRARNILKSNYARAARPDLIEWAAGVLTRADKASLRGVSTAITHKPGNSQILADGKRWHLPAGESTNKIPLTDVVGDRLQSATSAAASRWNRTMLTATERQAIQQAHANGKHWLGNLLEKQAKGRWVEDQVRPQFPGLTWGRKGVDATDPATGLRYDILSGTKSNLDLHAKRMPSIIFRMIGF
ncbi:MAG: hypothetical protein C0467_32530, partial [Planctomycetaceae bacterium]|nr:hypothetical protein [Planctomycetaceae bacterium]